MRFSAVCAVLAALAALQLASSIPTTTVPSSSMSPTITSTIISVNNGLSGTKDTTISEASLSAASKSIATRTSSSTTTTSNNNINNNRVGESGSPVPMVQYLSPVTNSRTIPTTLSPPATTQTIVNVVTSTATLLNNNNNYSPTVMTTTTDSPTNDTVSTTESKSLGTMITSATTSISKKPMETETNQLQCQFSNRTYQLGQTWFDDCVSKCRCVQSNDNSLAIIACEPRCPTYIDILPDNCRMDRSPDDECCLQKVCTQEAPPSLPTTSTQELPLTDPALSSSSLSSPPVMSEQQPTMAPASPSPPSSASSSSMKHQQQKQQEAATTTQTVISQPTTSTNNMAVSRAQSNEDLPLSITVTDIRLKPTLKSIDSASQPSTDQPSANIMGRSASSPIIGDHEMQPPQAPLLTPAKTLPYENDLEQQAATTTTATTTTTTSSSRLPKKIVSSYTVTEAPPSSSTTTTSKSLSISTNASSSNNKPTSASGKLIPAGQTLQPVTTQKVPLPTTIATTTSTTTTTVSPPPTMVTNLAGTVKLLQPVTASSSTSAATTTTTTTTTTPAPPTNQDQNNMMAANNDGVEESPITVDPYAEDLCIISEHNIYRINQDVFMPTCNKVCRCQYSQQQTTNEDPNATSIGSNNSNITVYKIRATNLHSNRQTEITCCAPISESKLIPSSACPKPRVIASTNFCECPYVGCDDQLPPYDIPSTLLAVMSQQEAAAAAAAAASNNNPSTPIDDLATNRKVPPKQTSCLIRGHQLAINETFNDECHSRCKCTDQLQVQCEPVTCPSQLPPPSAKCQNWAYDTSFKAEAPNCCPPLLCKDGAEDGSCSVVGITIKHLEPVPDVIVGCNQRCICMRGKFTCESTCPPLGDSPPIELECQGGALPIQDQPTTGCQCPKWTCPIIEEEMALQNVTIVALNATTVRVRFTLPLVAVNQHGHAELHYTMDPERPGEAWTVQKFGRPERLFDVPMIEYPLNRFKPETTYYFKIRVVLDDTSLFPEAMESSIVQLQMPQLPSNYFIHSKRPTILFPTMLETTPKDGVVAKVEAVTNSTTVATSTSTTTTSTSPISSSSTTTTTTTVTPPRVSKHDFNLRSRPLSPNAMLVQWLPLTAKERPYVDSYQIKYSISNENSNSNNNNNNNNNWKLSQLLHKETDQTIIYDLAPGTSYAFALLVNQAPDTPVIVEAHGSQINMATFEDEQQKLLSNMEQAHLKQITQLQELLTQEKERNNKNKQQPVAPSSSSSFNTDNNNRNAPTIASSMTEITDQNGLAQIDSNDVTPESNKLTINLSDKWSSFMKSQAIDLFKVYYQELSSIKSNTLEATSDGNNNLNHHLFVEPTEDGKLIIDNLYPEREYKIWFDVFLRNGKRFNSTSFLIARTSTSMTNTNSEFQRSDLRPLVNSVLEFQSQYVFYVSFGFAGLMTLSFVIVLYLLLKKSSSAIAPISSQSAYDNPSFTKLVSYYEPPTGPDPNNNNIDSPIKPPPTNNQTIYQNGNGNNNNIQPYNTGWEYQRAEGRLI